MTKMSFKPAYTGTTEGFTSDELRFLALVPQTHYFKGEKCYRINLGTFQFEAKTIKRLVQLDVISTSPNSDEIKITPKVGWELLDHNLIMKNAKIEAHKLSYYQKRIKKVNKNTEVKKNTSSENLLLNENFWLVASFLICQVVGHACFSSLSSTSEYGEGTGFMAGFFIWIIVGWFIALIRNC